jgi:hypothetical protein
LEDINALIKEFKRIKRKDIVCALVLMERYGFRAGIFENMKVDDKGNWNSVSKERSMQGKFSLRETKMIKESGLLKLQKCTLQNIIKKYTNILCKNGTIDCSFSCHDIRSYRITADMREAHDAVEMKIVSEKYHKNINTSMGYVRVK